MNEAPETPQEVAEVYRSRRDTLCDGPRARRLARRRTQGDDVRLGADPRDASRTWARSPFAELLAREARVAVSPGVGFGPGGEGFVRFALVENEHRIRQATRAVRRLLEEAGASGGR